MCHENGPLLAGLTTRGVSHRAVWFAAVLSARLIRLILHDRFVRPDLPWREGDIEGAMINVAIYFAISLLVIRTSRAGKPL